MNIEQKSQKYLNHLCNELPNRSTGSIGNIQACEFFLNELKQIGLEVEYPKFEAMDWSSQGAKLKIDTNEYEVFSSTYSNPCCETAPLSIARNIDELEKGEFKNTILLICDDLAKEQLMPKNFVFYNPDEHKRIISLLENKAPLAIICATGRNSELAGGAYPYPLIEDGDFDIPSVYMTEENGKELRSYAGKKVFLQSLAKRSNSYGHNIIGKIGNPNGKRVVITAHIDAKQGTSGAIDNGTGVVILLLLAELLKDYKGERLIEITAFNGEDYYAVSGQMDFISRNEGKFGDMLLNINLDGIGISGSRTAVSFYNTELLHKDIMLKLIENNEELIEGSQWVQGDHSIFVYLGVPAIAISSEWFIDNMATQDITHTPKDNTSMVDISKLGIVTKALNDFVRKI